MRCKLILSVAAAVVTGCAGSPWSPWWASKPPPKPPAAAAGTAPAAPATAAAKADPQALQQVMADLEQAGTIDPAARDRLLADLRQTDPSLWPLMLQQFRAAAAYRRQLEEREKPSGLPASGVTVLGPPGSASERPVRLPEIGPGTSGPSPAAAAGGRYSGPLPAGGQVAVAAGAAPGLCQVDTCQPLPRVAGAAAGSAAAAGSPAGAAAGIGSKPAGPPGGVVQAGYQSPISSGRAGLTASGQWQACLAGAIQAIEAESKAKPKGQSDPTLEARLRMLYLLAGRRDDAMLPIPAASSSDQDYWSKQIFGLYTWLDAERTPDAARRAGETKRILSEALARLGESAPLVVRNLAFCTAVLGYGSIQPFKKSEFAPDQEVLLYAEVENFRSESTAKGFHTSLRSSYQIFDSRGQRVADHEFPVVEEFCQNPRRDYFIGYHLRLPKRIYPGKHKLQLTVEDSQSHKVGQSTIGFTVKGEEEGPAPRE